MNYNPYSITPLYFDWKCSFSHRISSRNWAWYYYWI